MKKQVNIKIGLICSSGGHLLQLHSLKPFWQNFERFWVTYPTSDAESLLAGENVHWLSHSGERKFSNAIRDIPFTFGVLRTERPRMLLTTGARIAVPFFYLGRIMGCKLIYLESISRVKSFSLSFKLAAPVAHERLVQWPEQEGKRGTIYKGGILDLLDSR
jgi:UDP-N-acetylglucosamine:LPS N-acetylglucosamine transferase